MNDLEQKYNESLVEIQRLKNGIAALKVMNEMAIEREKKERDELLDMLNTLVARRLRASLGSPQSSDGRYEKAVALLNKHGIDVVKHWRKTRVE